MSATLAERLKEARTACGLTQQALADMLEITPAAISQWELGQTFPDCGKLPSLSDILGVSLDWLFKGEGARVEKLPDGMRFTPIAEAPAPVFCSFCGKHQDFVGLLVGSGAANRRKLSAFICNECVDLSVEVVRQRGVKAGGAA